MTAILDHDLLCSFNSISLSSAELCEATPVDLLNALSKEVKIAGAIAVAQTLRVGELRDICDNFLKLQYAPGVRSRMLLALRFAESFEECSVHQWFAQCDDRRVLTVLSSVGRKEALRLTNEKLRALAIARIIVYGEKVILHRFSPVQLSKIRRALEEDSSEQSSEKSKLVCSVVCYQIDLEERNAFKRVSFASGLRATKDRKPSGLKTSSLGNSVHSERTIRHERNYTETGPHFGDNLSSSQPGRIPDKASRATFGRKIPANISVKDFQKNVNH